MPYTRPYAAGFVDYPNTTTPMTAAVMNTMDLGIKAANDQIQTLTTAQRTALTPTIGQLVWDSNLNELFVWTNATGANAWQGIGNVLIGTFAARPATPFVGQLYYQTDTDELVKYVTDVDGTNRWMVADHDYRRNVVINGGFDVWQRGTSFNPTSSTSTTGANYGADRWQFLQATTSATAFTRQAITSTDPVGFNYYTRVQRANTLTLTTAYTMQTSFESQNIQQFRGKYVTLSFWARAGANYSAASSYLVSNIVTGTGTDNTVGNFTSNTVNTTTNNVLTTSWKRFLITTSAVLAATITQLGVSFVFTPVGTAGAADYFDITGVQVEPASASSDFEFRDAGEELRRCQRYYYRQGPYVAGNQRFGAGFIITTSTSAVMTQFPVTLRSVPTALEQSGTAANYAVSNLNANTACTSVPSFSNASVDTATTIFTTGATLVAGQGCQGVNNSTTTAYLGWSAEL